MKQVNVWINEKDLAIIEAAAEKEGRTRSNYIVHYTLQKAKEDVEQ